jgi:hypothetical protein
VTSQTQQLPKKFRVEKQLGGSNLGLMLALLGFWLCFAKGAKIRSRIQTPFRFEAVRQTSYFSLFGNSYFNHFNLDPVHAG